MGNIFYHLADLQAYSWFVSPHGQAVIQASGIFILIVYAFTTYKLWKESKKQTELSIAPFITIKYDNEKKQFYARNCGRGVAFNVEMGVFKLLVAEIKEPLLLKFDPIDFLEPSEQKPFEINKGTNPEWTDVLFYRISPDGHKKEDYTFFIQYKNTLGHQYYTEISTGKSGIRVVRIYRSGIINALIREFRRQRQSYMAYSKIYWQQLMQKLKIFKK
jgi:hypothetical protein